MSESTNDYQYWSDQAPWELFGSEIIIEVHHILTEPVCPTAKVRFENPERTGVDVISRGIGNTIDEAIQDALTKAKVKLAELVELRKNTPLKTISIVGKHDGLLGDDIFDLFEKEKHNGV